MGPLTRYGVRRGKPLAGPIEVKVTLTVIVDVTDEDGCTTRRAMGEWAVGAVEQSPQHYLRRESENKTLSVDAEALGCR